MIDPDNPFPRATARIAEALASAIGPELHPSCSDLALAILIDHGRWRIEQDGEAFVVTTDAELDLRTGQPPRYRRTSYAQADMLRTLLAVSAALDAYDLERANVVSIASERRRRSPRG